jgi:hypothetical protein
MQCGDGLTYTMFSGPGGLGSNSTAEQPTFVAIGVPVRPGSLYGGSTLRRLRLDVYSGVFTTALTPCPESGDLARVGRWTRIPLELPQNTHRNPLPRPGPQLKRQEEEEVARLKGPGLPQRAKELRPPQSVCQLAASIVECRQMLVHLPFHCLANRHPRAEV